MPLLRTYDAARGTVTVSLHDAYLDRLCRDSDIKEYLPLLHDEAASRDKPAIVELGTRKGNSTLALLAGAAVTGGHVWSADIEDIRLYEDGMLPWRSLPSWTFLHGSSLHPAVRAQLPEVIDVLFNDASHTYQNTLDECRAYLPRVRAGGVALFHDTKLLGRYSHNFDWAPVEGVPPVRKALDDYCAETGLSWEELDGQFGMGVIRL